MKELGDTQHQSCACGKDMLHAVAGYPWPWHMSSLCHPSKCFHQRLLRALSLPGADPALASQLATARRSLQLDFFEDQGVGVMDVEPEEDEAPPSEPSSFEEEEEEVEQPLAAAVSVTGELSGAKPIPPSTSGLLNMC